MSISLYDIAVGPTHFDFKTGNDKLAGRVKFDLKLSQVIEMEITSTTLICNMEENLTERFYLYNMYLLDGKKRTRSEMSSTFENTSLNMAVIDRGKYGESNDTKNSFEGEREPDDSDGNKARGARRQGTITGTVSEFLPIDI